MDRSDVYSALWMIVLYAWMIVTRVLLPTKQLQDIFGTLGIIILFVGMIGTDYIIMMKVAPFNHIKGILRPTPKRGPKTLSLFIKNVSSKRVKGSNIHYSTTFGLAFESKHHIYGKVKEVIFHHEYPITDRIVYEPGMANYKGYVVKHPNVASVILYEYPSGAYAINRAEPIPIFRLKEGPGDYWLNPIVLAGKATHNPTSPKLAEVLAENKRLRYANRELRRAKLDEHQQRISLGEFMEEQKNELVGVLNTKVKVFRAAWELMFLIRRAQVTIENAVRGYKPWKQWFSKYMVYLAIVGLILIIIAVKPELQVGIGQWFSVGQNQIFLVLMAGVFAAIFYYGYERKAK